MNRIVEILMKRDDMTYDEAKNLVIETRDMMDEALVDGDTFEAESIFEEMLGLEPDYIMDIL